MAVQSGIEPHIGLEELSPFERLLTEISTLFINLPADRIDQEIDSAQSRICKLLEIDRSTLWVASADDPGTLELAHLYQPPGLPVPPAHMSGTEFFPWTTQKVLEGETFAISKMAELPEEARRDRESFAFFGTKSGVYVPLSVGKGPVFGLVSFAVTGEERQWSNKAVKQFQLVAQIFANALSRERADSSLQERLQFEEMLADVTAHFIKLPPDQMDGAIVDVLRRVCECLGLDLCALWQWSVDPPGLLTLTHIYRSLEGPPLPEPMDAEAYFPWSREQVAAGRIVAVGSMADLPPEAARDAESYSHFGIKSTCVFPLAAGDGPPLGALGFNTLRTEYRWGETLLKRLQLVAQIFTHALTRKLSEGTIVQSEQRLRLITNALPVLIAYVGADLRYRFNNDAYRVWFGVGPEEAFGRHIREVIGEGFFQAAMPYIERALSGERVRCALDVETFAGRPLSLEAIYVPDVGERGEVRGIYVLAMDVTERNLAQQESRRLQDELFHAGRVSTMGELAATLAHEINQPLSAIMSNAQAARRYLAAPSPDLEEVRDILGDIVKEDARASEVINRLRGFLRKEKITREPLDLNAVFREVVMLLNSDAARRSIKVALNLDPHLPGVQGDRIQLQQVALNLVLNAFDAMPEGPGLKRGVVIRTWRQDSEVLAAVSDTGRGLYAAESGKIFNAFYTTKPHGLGMGLSICRSILNGHHGRIWAENNPDRGATFYFSLPAATSQPIGMTPD